MNVCFLKKHENLKSTIIITKRVAPHSLSMCDSEVTEMKVRKRVFELIKPLFSQEHSHALDKIKLTVEHVKFPIVVKKWQMPHPWELTFDDKCPGTRKGLL